MVRLQPRSRTDGLVVVAGHLRLLRRRPSGRAGRDPAADGRRAGRRGRLALSFPLGYASVTASSSPCGGRPTRSAGCSPPPGSSGRYGSPWGRGSVSAPRRPPPAPGRPAGRRDRGACWAPAIALGVTLPALLVPDGRLRSPRWRVVVATAVRGSRGPAGRQPDARPASRDPAPIANPFKAGAAGAAASVLTLTAVALHC